MLRVPMMRRSILCFTQRSATAGSTSQRILAANKRLFSSPASNVPSTTSKTSKSHTGLSTAGKTWSELSTPQKVVVASKTTVNLGVILTGLGLTGAIVYYITSELFSSQSTTSIFNRTVDLIRENEEIKDILGEPIKGHGEPSRSKRRRNRRIMSQEVVDLEGKDHLLMRFYVEGPLNQGTVLIDMIKDEENKKKWIYKKLYVDIPGQGLPSKRIYLHQL
ncbi:TIM21-domain-containing protein [Mycotypha africana]|uniref:TIM21-domain-containing protein n=1 Tax=Mycotypha africana TaxID=64632 RepID=UPI0023000AD5|nr:TIM21-domain-containing protein [Mycotypha africana]KAI8968454.1 TIM21-domain-containing protein [Mycotypha africana]